MITLFLTLLEGITRFKRILIAIDGSGHSKKALEFACDLANQYDAYLAILHVASPAQSHTMVLGSAAMIYQGNQKGLDQIAEIIIDSAKEIAETAGCKNLKTHIQQGVPAQQILQFSRDNNVDLIVLGSRGLSDVAGFFQGSVSHKVNHSSECSCITVR